MDTLQKKRVRKNTARNSTARKNTAHHKIARNSTAHGNTVQMNTRIDADLKRRYERVLAQHGLTHSQVVRELCEYVADEGKLPDMTTQEAQQAKDEEIRKRVEAIEKLGNLIPDALERLGLPRDTPSPVNGMSDEDLKELRRDWAYEDYLEKSKHFVS